LLWKRQFPPRLGKVGLSGSTPRHPSRGTNPVRVAFRRFRLFVAIFDAPSRWWGRCRQAGRSLSVIASAAKLWKAVHALELGRPLQGRPAGGRYDWPNTKTVLDIYRTPHTEKLHDASDAPVLLRACRERPSGDRAAESSDEFAAVGSR
jgi:hypothetical protein